ncbi:MAG TPA: methyltransferase domain-containing protein [Desulfuromonadales bacterium]|nr:methyltransferase domain-containing protein [Desulfuromonadales bacterium]
MPDSDKSRYVPALGFHFLTPVYDAVVALTGREGTVKQALIRQAGLEPGQRVLDLASGTGTLAVMIKQHHPGVEVVGLDADARIIGLARRKAGKAQADIRFDQGLSYRLPYAADEFDGVFASMFLHHLPWPDKVSTAREILRVLKPGACVYVADWGTPANILMRGLFLTVQVLDGFQNTRDHAEGRLLPLFAENGFVEVTRQNAFNTIYGTIVLASASKPA